MLDAAENDGFDVFVTTDAQLRHQQNLAARRIAVVCLLSTSWPRIKRNVDAVVSAYYDISPDPSDPDQRVVFGTSGHRGSSLDGAFNEAHIAATTQAICDDMSRQLVWT